MDSTKVIRGCSSHQIPKNARCSVIDQSSCMSHVLIHSYRLILGRSIFKVHIRVLTLSGVDWSRLSYISVVVVTGSPFVYSFPSPIRTSFSTNLLSPSDDSQSLVINDVHLSHHQFFPSHRDITWTISSMVTLRDKK
jgi:hypothetical protein